MENLKKNDNCYIGFPTCGYVFESSKSCFVACPSDVEYALYYSTLKNILNDNNYECHIAVRETSPAKGVFCTKICSKIIQSQFCIVFLDPSILKKQTSPNPNVYFEYGMMLSQNKYIIPFQNEKYNLPFNVYNLDTIKYNNSNFEKRAIEQIAKAVKIYSKTEIVNVEAVNRLIVTFYQLNGYTLPDLYAGQNFKLISDFGFPYGFTLFMRFSINGIFKYVGYFVTEDPKKIILNTKLLIDRFSDVITLAKATNLNNPNPVQDQLLLLENAFSVDIIIPDNIDKEDIMNNIVQKIKTHKDALSVYYFQDFEDYVDEAYKSIEEVKINTK